MKKIIILWSFLIYLNSIYPQKSTTDSIPKNCRLTVSGGVKQNFCGECFEKLELQIQEELKAFYTYLYFADFFQRYDVALEGFYKYFMKLSNEEHEHATTLMSYLNKRGVGLTGTERDISLREIPKPSHELKITDRPTLKAMELAFEMEKQINDKLIRLRSTATTCMDYDMQEFIDKEYLAEQVESIKELFDHITNLKRIGDGLGDFLYDEKLRKLVS